MNAFKINYLVIFFILGALLFSCKKEVDNQKKMLQQYDWEQLDSLPWDSTYAKHKFFHSLQFREDGIYLAETNWSYYQLLMRSETGKYQYYAESDRIVFPEAFDTIDEGSLFLRYYLSPWQIMQISDTLMVVRSEPDYQPPDGIVRYEDDTLYFRPKE